MTSGWDAVITVRNLTASVFSWSPEQVEGSQITDVVSLFLDGNLRSRFAAANCTFQFLYLAKWRFSCLIRSGSASLEDEEMLLSFHRTKMQMFQMVAMPALFTPSPCPHSNALFWLKVETYTMNIQEVPPAFHESINLIDFKVQIADILLDFSLPQSQTIWRHFSWSFFSPWYKQIPPDHWGSARPEGNSPQGPFCPNQCLCSWWPQRCRGEERVSLWGVGGTQKSWLDDRSGVATC